MKKVTTSVLAGALSLVCVHAGVQVAQAATVHPVVDSACQVSLEESEKALVVDSLVAEQEFFMGRSWGAEAILVQIEKELRDLNGGATPADFAKAPSLKSFIAAYKAHIANFDDTQVLRLMRDSAQSEQVRTASDEQLLAAFYFPVLYGGAAAVEDAPSHEQLLNQAKAYRDAGLSVPASQSGPKEVALRKLDQIRANAQLSPSVLLAKEGVANAALAAFRIKQEQTDRRLAYDLVLEDLREACVKNQHSTVDVKKLFDSYAVVPDSSTATMQQVPSVSTPEQNPLSVQVAPAQGSSLGFGAIFAMVIAALAGIGGVIAAALNMKQFLPR
ncbi:MAG: hypothetical protein Q4A31_10640 [Corynebacterium sp.]|uniref:hypothetical protein n=1 Tax=Corynebacterium sp. TaxID=1720 RepID=UPI0026DBABD0|nr:hypothetical protein [Corynebacterium sp.]MDO4762365.1 hypothetical protein [Corynebacterium sp.]